MIRTLKQIPGFLWALPITLIALLLIALSGGTKTFFKRPDKLAFYAVPKSTWIFGKRYFAMALGCIVILRTHDIMASTTTLVHEDEHLRQCRVLGPFVMLLYPLAGLVGLLLYKKPYRANVFEIYARKASGEDNGGM